MTLCPFPANIPVIQSMWHQVVPIQSNRVTQSTAFAMAAVPWGLFYSFWPRGTVSCAEHKECFHSVAKMTKKPRQEERRRWWELWAICQASPLCFLIFRFCSVLESFYFCSGFHGNRISCLSSPALHFLFDFPPSQDTTFFSFWKTELSVGFPLVGGILKGGERDLTLSLMENLCTRRTERQIFQVGMSGDSLAKTPFSITIFHVVRLQHVRVPDAVGPRLVVSTRPALAIFSTN